MKANNTLLAWNGDRQTDKPSPDKAPPLSLAIGPLIGEGEGDWTAPYGDTGGACWIPRRTAKEQTLLVMSDWWTLVFVYGLDPYLVHRAFCLIDEYVGYTQRLGAGPAKDEPGHNPEYGYGRCVRLTPTPLIITPAGRAWHFWPGGV